MKKVHNPKFVASFMNPQWHCSCGHIYGCVPEKYLQFTGGHNRAFEWLEIMRAKHEGKSYKPLPGFDKTGRKVRTVGDERG